MRERLLASLIFFFIGAATVGAQMPVAQIKEVLDKKNKTEIRVSPLLDQIPPSGYYPVRVFIYNGGKFDRKWSFRFTSTDADYSDTGNELRSNFSASCDSKQTIEIDLIVPLVTAFQRGYSTSTMLDLVVNSAPSPPLTFSLETPYVRNWPAVMISETIYTGNKGNLTTEANRVLSGMSGHSGGTSGVQFGAAFNPKAMAEDWRAYSGYDSCLLTEEDWDDLTPGARNALLRWNRLGGSIVIYSQSGSDLSTIRTIDGVKPGERSAQRSWGLIQTRNISSTGDLDAPETVRLVHSTIPTTTVGSVGGNKLSSVTNDFRPNWPLQTLFGKKTAHIIFFILVLIAFGILVGPVNLFVFAPAGKRHKLFVTTPIISLAASALLVVLILFQDGFGGRGLRNVLIEIGPEHNAFVSQEQIARTGVLLNTSFTSSEPGYISPVLIAESRWARITDGNSGGNGRYTVDVLENGLKVAGDWFQSRSEHGHIFETVRSTRGRIELVGSGATPTITSTFEFPLATLYYTDPNGDLWTASDIKQGHNTALVSASSPVFKGWLNSEKLLFTARNRARISMTEKRQGHFFATTEDASAVNTLGAINWKETHTLISGPVVTP